MNRKPHHPWLSLEIISSSLYHRVQVFVIHISICVKSRYSGETSVFGCDISIQVRPQYSSDISKNKTIVLLYIFLTWSTSAKHTRFCQHGSLSSTQSEITIEAEVSDSCYWPWCILVCQTLTSTHLSYGCKAIVQEVECIHPNRHIANQKSQGTTVREQFRFSSYQNRHSAADS